MLEYLKKLELAILSENLLETETILKKILDTNSAFEYVNPILNIMENNPYLDYGMPGPLVHFMEKFYKNGYEELLINSVSKKPTLQTIWMINRVINDPNLQDRNVYLELLENILNRDDVDDYVKNEIFDLLY